MVVGLSMRTLKPRAMWTLIVGAGWLIITGHPVFGAISFIAAFILAYDKM